VLVVGRELSGKTYLLKKMCCEVANLGHLPVLVEGNVVAQKMPRSTPELLIKYLTWYSTTVLRNVEQLGRTIYLFIDNVDSLTEAQIDLLRSTAHEKIVIVLAGRKPRTLKGFETYYISGVKSGAVQKFVRSLDMDRLKANALTDRTLQYINRTFSTSGLPMNAFTVSMMLAECQVEVTDQRLATPTMGRLIQRFVEDQLGSHADSLGVDFETKNRFLTTLGGANASSFPRRVLRRRLAKYISSHGDPHKLDVFEKDLVESGLLEKDDDTDMVRWTTPIFREYFWVCNLVREKKYGVLSKRLLHNGAMSIASITGSQMGNAHTVLDHLLREVREKAWMKTSIPKTDLPAKLPQGEWLPSDEQEEVLLSKVEDVARNGPVDSTATAQEATSKEIANTLESDQTTKQFLIQWAKRLVEEKHYVVSNIAAVLVNARSLTREDKENAVLCVIRSTLQISKHLLELFHITGKGRISPLIADFLSKFLWLMFNDIMIGDPFLIEIFQGLERGRRSIDENIALTDLLVECGGRPPKDYIEHLKHRKDIADVTAVYFRLVSTYYFRFHKADERAQLREAMKEVRKLAKGFSLPPVT
jgi:hypothetical protein